MKENTTCVLALDAADYELVKEFDCENVLLEKNQPLKTKAAPGDELGIPKTLHIWPLIATGMEPDIDTDERQWNNPFWNRLRYLTSWLPIDVRRKLGALPRILGADQEFERLEKESIFQQLGGESAIDGWPGVTPSPRLDEGWLLCENIVNGRVSEDEARIQAIDNLYEALTWLQERPRYGLPIAGTHAHVLDIAGHSFANNREVLREWYRLTDRAVGELRESVDELVVISDHGMQVEWMNEDDEPGIHSFRAMISAEGIDENLPRSVDETHEFLRQIGGDSIVGEIDMAASREHLADLGYIDG